MGWGGRDVEAEGDRGDKASGASGATFPAGDVYLSEPFRNLSGPPEKLGDVKENVAAATDSAIVFSCAFIKVTT